MPALDFKAVMAHITPSLVGAQRSDLSTHKLFSPLLVDRECPVGATPGQRCGYHQVQQAISLQINQPEVADRAIPFLLDVLLFAIRECDSYLNSANRAWFIRGHGYFCIDTILLNYLAELAGGFCFLYRLLINVGRARDQRHARKDD